MWGLAGAAVNRALVFLEATQRVKAWPWAAPDGPGGALFAVAQVLHLGIGTAVTAAASTTPVVANGFTAFGIGAVAPLVVKKLAGYTLAQLPGGAAKDDPGEQA